MMKIERVPTEDIQDVGDSTPLAVPDESPEKVTLFPIKNACSNHFTPRRRGGGSVWLNGERVVPFVVLWGEMSCNCPKLTLITSATIATCGMSSN